MPAGKLNCCCEPPHCGIVYADVSRDYIGLPCPLPGDLDQIFSIDGATSSGPEKTDFSTITARYGMQGTWGYVDQEMPACAYYSPVRYLKEEVHYFGKVWGALEGEGSNSLHDFDYTYTRERRFELPLPNDYIYNDHATNIAEEAYDWSIDTDTGTVTETGGAVTDVLFTSPGLGEGGAVFIPPLSSIYGSAEFSILAGDDDDGDGYPDTVSLSLVVHVPADYHAAGSAAYDVTLVRTFSVPFNYATFEAACNFMLDHIQLERPGHIYTTSDSWGTWYHEPDDKILVWGYEYSPVWSCEMDEWPNRVLVLEVDFLLHTGDFDELASARNASYNQLYLLRTRFGVQTDDTGCLVSKKTTEAELPGEGDGVLDLTPCTLDGGGAVIGDPYINCHPAALGPGNYVFSGPGDHPNGYQFVSRQLIMNGGIGLGCTTLPDCVDALAEWDGTNPDPETVDNGCCFPDPP